MTSGSVSNPSWSFRYKTPEGSTTIIVQDLPRPHVQIFVGKAGTVVAALAHTVAELTNHCLEHQTLDSVIDLLSGISSDVSVYNANSSVWCRSLAEAVSFALLEFSRKKSRDD